MDAVQRWRAIGSPARCSIGGRERGRPREHSRFAIREDSRQADERSAGGLDYLERWKSERLEFIRAGGEPQEYDLETELALRERCTAGPVICRAIGAETARRTLMR